MGQICVAEVYRGQGVFDAEVLTTHRDATDEWAVTALGLRDAAR